MTYKDEKGIKILFETQDEFFIVVSGLLIMSCPEVLLLVEVELVVRMSVIRDRGCIRDVVRKLDRICRHLGYIWGVAVVRMDFIGRGRRGNIQYYS